MISRRHEEFEALRRANEARLAEKRRQRKVEREQKRKRKFIEQCKTMLEERIEKEEKERKKAEEEEREMRRRREREEREAQFQRELEAQRKRDAEAEEKKKKFLESMRGAPDRDAAPERWSRRTDDERWGRKAEETASEGAWGRREPVALSQTHQQADVSISRNAYIPPRHRRQTSGDARVGGPVPVDRETASQRDQEREPAQREAADRNGEQNGGPESAQQAGTDREAFRQGGADAVSGRGGMDADRWRSPQSGPPPRGETDRWTRGPPSSDSYTPARRSGYIPPSARSGGPNSGYSRGFERGGYGGGDSYNRGYGGGSRYGRDSGYPDRQPGGFGRDVGRYQDRRDAETGDGRSVARSYVPPSRRFDDDPRADRRDTPGFQDRRDGDGGDGVPVRSAGKSYVPPSRRYEEDQPSRSERGGSRW